ncbi:PREDICTED: signaling lymphocytic activation molecule-like, partial [Buceros rhinoceros silvestris]|uniref:signaling lymphocytic activation molecule-like n=1 Tax=Buceros rhinoceros silvestris TaxID=175836 RepID=UPI0005292F1C
MVAGGRGMDHRARETVLGILGKATVLRIPPELQDLTLRFGEAVWKRETEDPRSKLVLLKYSDGSYINYRQERMRFHELDFSLELLNTSRQDWQPVSDPSIEILHWTPVNGSCTVTLNCTAERGDSVSYSWGSWDTNTSGLCTRNGSLLHLSYPLKNTSITCTCTASNPVSSRVITFNTSQCSLEQAGSTGLTTEHLVLLVVPIATVMVLIGIFMVTRLVMHV